jgi:hypothetical protein
VQNAASALKGEASDDAFCGPVGDPDWLTVECHDYSSCCYEWAAGEWQDDKCTDACGPSIKPRHVRCERRAACGDAGSALETVLETFCDADAKPPTTAACYSTAQCCYRWHMEDWSQCEPACGASRMVREVWCERCDKTQVDRVQCTEERAGPAPEDQKPCSSFDTCSYAWHTRTADLGTCYDGFRNGDEAGLDCGGSCPPCKVDGGWSAYGEWSECSARCGLGQTQSVRTCDNPPPAHGGKDCEGDAVLFKGCRAADCGIAFGDRCSFTGAAPAGTYTYRMQLFAKKKELVTRVPSGRAGVMIKVVGDADMDLSLETRAGKKLVSYSMPNANWGWASFEFQSGKIQSCTDGCDEGVVRTFKGDGLPHRLNGDVSYNSEWIFLERTVDELLLFVHSWGSGAAEVQYQFDCPEDCGSCRQAVPAGDPTVRAPTSETVTGHLFPRAAVGESSKVSDAGSRPSDDSAARPATMRGDAESVTEPTLAAELGSAALGPA